MFLLGKRVLADAGAHPPRAQDLAVVIDEADDELPRERTEELVRRWQAHGRSVVVVRFPKAAALPRDLVDPAEPNARPGRRRAGARRAARGPAAADHLGPTR